MNTLTIEAAATKLKITEEEVKRMCKSGSLEVVEVAGSVPGVSEQSVFEFLGEEYVEPETVPKRKAGRQPKVLTLQEAAELIGDGHNPDSIAQMAFDELLEEWLLPASEEMGVTNRSVQEFLKNVTVVQEEESSKDEEITEEITHIEETKPETEGLISLLAHEEAVQEFIELIQDPVENACPEMIPLSEMRAAVKIARMQGELDTYRSMQSFERRA